MFGDFGKMISLLGDLKTRLPEIQKKLEESTFTGVAGDGAVTAVVNGKLKIVEVKIDKEALGDADTEVIADLVKAAMSTAQAEAGAAAKAAVADLTGGMEIPGLSGLGGML